MEAKVLKNEMEYEAALAYISSLMDAEPGSAEEEKLELFSLLVESYEKEHHPIDLPDPVSAIVFRMVQQGLTRKDLAEYLGSMSRVSEVLGRKRQLSLAMIRSLHSSLGIPYDVLLQEQGMRLEACRHSLSDYPFKEMVKRGYFETFSGTLSKAKDISEELLDSFFSVFQGTETDMVYCRKNKETVDRLALKAWQARVIHLTQKDKLPVYDNSKVNPLFLKEVVKLSQFSQGPKLVREFLNKKGIHFIVLPHLEKTYLDGACFMATDNRPVIALTLRHDRLDHFWFTLLHELAHLHLHLHGSAMAFFDDTEKGHHDEASTQENEADTLARDTLISPTDWKTVNSRLEASFTEATVYELSDELDLPAAIVAGRIRWEKNDYTLFSRIVGNKAVRRLFVDDVFCKLHKPERQAVSVETMNEALKIRLRNEHN